MHRASPYTSQVSTPKSGGRSNSRIPTTPSNPVNPSNDFDLLCNYSSHLCRREKLSGFDFCLRHILEDKNCPFKQCNFHFRSQRRCPRAAPKSDKKDGYCSEHARKALIARQKISSNSVPTDLTQKCLQGLLQYKRDPIKMEDQAASGSSRGPQLSGPEFGTPRIGEFRDLEKDINPFQVLSRPATASTSSHPPRQTEESECDDDDEDDDSHSIENAWRGDGDSDAESVDSEMENPLKHSGVYTSEEVIRIMRDKLIRLQKLYIDQFQRLRYLLKEERRSYRIAVKREQEAEVTPLHSQARENLDEITAYDEAKAMTHYNKPQGLESVLYAELSEKRQRLTEFHPSTSQMVNSGSMASSSGVSGAGPSTAGSASGSSSGNVKSKCSFNLTSTTKCGEICVPLAKFCIKHILQDTNQVLFRHCGISAACRDDDLSNGDGPCETPIADLFESSTCVFHTSFAPPVAMTIDEKTQKFDAAMNTEVTSNGDLKNGPL